MRGRRLLRRTGLELLHLRARIDVDDGLADLPHSPAEVPRDLRQLLGAEEQQDHDPERDQLPVSGHGASIDGLVRLTDVEITREDDIESAPRWMYHAWRLRTLKRMKRWLVICFLAFGLLLLALGAWAVQGVRWTLTGSRRRRGRLSPA